MKKTCITVMIIFIGLALTCCSSTEKKGEIEANTLHNTRLGIDISLGMDKERIDSLLGAPYASDTSYTYESGVSIMYKEGKAVLIFCGTDFVWSAIGNIKVGSSVADVANAYGVSGGDSLIISFDKNSKQTNDKEKAETYLVLMIDDDKVHSISLAIAD